MNLFLVPYSVVLLLQITFSNKLDVTVDNKLRYIVLFSIAEMCYWEESNNLLGSFFYTLFFLNLLACNNETTELVGGNKLNG